MSFASDAEEKYNRKRDVSIPITRQMTDVMRGMKGLYNMAEALVLDQELRGLSDAEQKALLYTTSYLVRPLPVNSLNKFDKATGFMETANEKMDEGIVAVERIFSNWLKGAKEEGVKQENIDAVQKVYDEQIKPLVEPPSRGSVPDEAKNIIMEIESAGNWAARNPNSSAAGLYQFTADTWKTIMNEAPELGLTASGRTSRDTSQQEAAMDYFTDRNAELLWEEGLELSTENLYALHFLGQNAGPRILAAAGHEKLKNLGLSKKVFESNGFSNNMKVRDFKAWVARKIKSAETKIANRESRIQVADLGE